jgi:hypothetical protein
MRNAAFAPANLPLSLRHSDPCPHRQTSVFVFVCQASQLFQQAQMALRFDDFETAKAALKRAVRLKHAF